jgi:hypothetical protein
MSVNAIKKGNYKVAVELLEYETDFSDILIVAVEAGCTRVIRSILAIEPHIEGSDELLEATLGQDDDVDRDLVLCAPRIPGSYPIAVGMDSVTSFIDVISLLRCYSPWGWYELGFTVPELVEYSLDLDHGDFMYLAQPEELDELLARAEDTCAVECISVLEEMIERRG